MLSILGMFEKDCGACSEAFLGRTTRAERRSVFFDIGKVVVRIGQLKSA